jgi:hypothetical protein
MPPKARVVLVGPTVGLLPDAFLRRGVDVLGGLRVTAPDAFLDVLMEGGSAYHFFGRSAEKVVLMRRAATGKIASGVVVHPAVMRRSPDFCSIAPSSATVRMDTATDPKRDSCPFLFCQSLRLKVGNLDQTHSIVRDRFPA